MVPYYGIRYTYGSPHTGIMFAMRVIAGAVVGGVAGLARPRTLRLAAWRGLAAGFTAAFLIPQLWLVRE